jgi:cation:H+ antiporter
LVVVAWLEFLACSALIATAGYWLAHYGDVIAHKTKLGGAWIGVILVATVTSLPELATGVSSVTLANAPDIAVGDVLGSCVFNLAMIAVLDFLYREMPIYRKASNGHILSAGFSSILIGLAVFSLLSGDAGTLRFGHVGIYTPAIFLLYLVAVRAIYVQERALAATFMSPEKYDELALRDAFVGYAINGAVVVAAGIAMPFAALHLAQVMGWGQSFVGTMLVAAATSLPEAASTIGALRIGAIDLAVGNLFGSNLFNILILGIDDLAYVDGPLLSKVSPSHTLSGVSALIMTGAAVVGLHYRPVTRVFKIAGWVSLGLVLTYVLNSLVLFLRGH